jgi:hypothetical protein
MSLVDDIDTAFAPNNAIVAVPSAQRFQRITDFHHNLPFTDHAQREPKFVQISRNAALRSQSKLRESKQRAKSEAVLPTVRQEARQKPSSDRKSLDQAGQHFFRTFTQFPCGQTGVNTAGYQAPSAPQRYTLQKPPLQFVEQRPGPPQVAGFAAALRFAASDGAIDIAIAAAAITPTIRNFVANFVIVKSSPFNRSPNVHERFDDHG